jgi:xanthine dehydrogenase accessory factor
MLEIYKASTLALANGEPIALAIIIQAETRWNVGAKMLIRRDGSTLGTLGDDRLTQLILPIAQRAINAGHGPRVAFKERAGTLVEASPFETGDVEVFVQVLLPSPTLLLIGAGHIGEALIRLAKLVGWRIVVVDDRQDFLAPARLPGADELILVPYDSETETLAPMPITITPSTFIVVATWGWDEPALKQIADSPAAFIGLVASSRKAIIIFRELMKEGISADALARIKVPVGLDLGGETPSEIALAIMAELLMANRGGSGEPLTRSKGSAIMKQVRGGS